MPIIKSAKKRVKTINKATVRNRKTKRSVKSSLKVFQASLATDKKQANELLAKAQSEIDTAVKKGVLHKNKANRKKAQLAKIAKKEGVKPSPAKVKKASVKKPATKSKSATTKKIASTKIKQTTTKKTTKK